MKSGLIFARSGFTLIEMIVAMAIFSLVSMGGVYLVKWMASMNNSILAVSDSLLSDISLRSLQAQLERSSLMRKGVVSCEGPTVLSGNTLSASVELTDKNAFTFAYSRNSMVVATDALKVNSLLIPGELKLQQGDLILLNSIDSQVRRGFFKVKAVFPAEQRIDIEVAPRSTALPAEIPCKLELPAQNELVNPLNTKKFSLDVVEFISYRLEDNSQKSSEKVLSAIKYKNFYSKDVVKDVALTRVVAGAFQQKYEKKGTDSGVYRADVTIKYVESVIGVSAEAQNIEKQIKVSGGFSINGSSIYNEYASVVLPVNEDIFPTCGVQVVEMPGNFIDHSTNSKASGYGERLPVVRFEAVYTESEVLKGAMLPQMNISLVPNKATAQSSRCWSHEDISWPEEGASSLPTLKSPSMSDSIKLESMETGNFTKMKTNSLVVPVFCSLPVDYTVNASMTFTSQSGARTINCTGLQVKQTVPKNKVWSYKNNQESFCKRASYLVDIKQLVSVDGKEKGPELYTDDESCTWNDPYKTSKHSDEWKYDRDYANLPCSYKKYLKVMADRKIKIGDYPRLKSVKLRPANTVIKGKNGKDIPLEILCTSGE